MKISISYPPIVNNQGQKAMVSQNRNVQFFKEPTYLLPVTYAQAASYLKEMGYDVYWDDGNSQLKTFDCWYLDLIEASPDVIVFESTTPVMKFYWNSNFSYNNISWIKLCFTVIQKCLCHFSQNNISSG